MNADLARFSPWLRYDSQESFRADSAATLTDSVGKSGPNVLKRKNGTVLAKAGAGLSLDFLAARYGGRRSRDDFLDAVGRDYVADARRLHAKPGYADRIYGHVAKDRKGATLAAVLVLLLLQRQAVPRPRLHEGDWEMIQLRPRRRRRARRRHVRPARQRRALRLERRRRSSDGAPIVYVARGSHASLMRKGRHDAPVVPDECDAKGPLVRPTLEELDPALGRVARALGQHPGRLAAGELEPARARSQHTQYTDPLSKHEAAKDCQSRRRERAHDGRRARPGADRSSRRAPQDGHAVVEWTGRCRRGDARPLARLARRRAAACDLPRRSARRRPGTETLPPALELGHSYFVIGRAVSENGIAGEPAVAPGEGHLAVAIPILLDCDPGHDDAMAMLLALASPEVELLGVTTVAGNQTLRQDDRQRAADPRARRPRRHPGRRRRRPAAGARARGRRRRPRRDRPRRPRPAAAAAAAPVGAHAVDFLAERIRAPRAPVTLVPTGPLTNIALLLARHPDVARELERIVLMGGAIAEGNVTPAAEFNIWADPEAAARVFASGLDVTMVGLDVTHQALLTDAARRAPARGRADRRRSSPTCIGFYARFHRERLRLGRRAGARRAGGRPRRPRRPRHDARAQRRDRLRVASCAAAAPSSTCGSAPAARRTRMSRPTSTPQAFLDLLIERLAALG